MQDMKSLLGKQNTESEGNPLQKIADAESEKKKPKKSPSDFNEEAIINMMMTGENSTGLFNPKQEDIVKEEDKDKIHTNTKDTLDIKTGKTVNMSKKYASAILEDMKKNPDKFKLKTPEGEMTVEEALRKGYNPITKKFEKSQHKENIDKALATLNDKDKQRLSELTDPANVGLAPADAEQLGLAPNSPMIKQPQQPQEQGALGIPQAQPAATPQIPGQEMTQPQAPANNIAALLGGGN